MDPSLNRPVSNFAITILISAFLILFAEVNEASPSFEEIIFPDIRIMASELVDDMIYSWIKVPPVSGETSLILTEVSAPIGLDNRFVDLVENRIYELFLKNPQLKLSLSHCSMCLQFIARSSPEKTTLSRGVDQPDAFKEFLTQNPDSTALALNFEASGRELVLVAHIYQLAKPQKLIWAQRYSTTMGLRQTLREANPLVSLEEARHVQNQILLGREPLKFVSRLNIINFSSQNNFASVAPLLFAEQALEAELLPNRNKRIGFTVGMTSIKDSVSGWSLGGRYSSLLLRERPSLVFPDFYWFMGLTYYRLQGVGAVPFAEDQLDVAKLLKENEDPKASLTSYRLGVEALIKYRFGISVYLEYFPGLKDSRIISQESFLIPYHGIGTSMVFQW